jgi:hypothetical protein
MCIQAALKRFDVFLRRDFLAYRTIDPLDERHSLSFRHPAGFQAVDDLVGIEHGTHIRRCGLHYSSCGNATGRRRKSAWGGHDGR